METEWKLADENDAGLWDNIVGSSPQGTVFHTWKCLKIIEKYSKTKLYPLIAQNGTGPIGCIPLFYQEKLWMRLLFSPPPHVALSRLGPVLAGYDGLKQYKKESNAIEFQRCVDDFISQISPDYLAFSSACLQDSRCYKWSGYCVEPTYNYVYYLDSGLDKVWSDIRRNTKQDIKRAQRRGLSVREGNSEDMVRIYELLVKRYAEQGIKTNVSKEYLLKMYEALHPPNLRVFVVEREGDVISGSIDVYFKDRVISWIGNAKAAEHANDLLSWECLKWAHDNGFRQYRIMGAAGEERLYSSYSKLNPQLIISFSVKRYSSFIPRLFSNIAGKSAIVKSWSDKI